MHETRELLAGGDVAMGSRSLPSVRMGPAFAILPWCDSALWDSRSEGVASRSCHRVHSPQERPLDPQELAADVRGALPGNAPSRDVRSQICDAGRGTSR